MKIKNVKRICSLVLAVMMVLPLFGITTAFAEETYRFDDFEDYEEGFTAFATTGYSEPKLASIVVDEGNKCIKIPEGGKLYYDNRVLAEDTDTIITSVNFKIKDTQSEGSVSGFTGALSQWAKVYVRLVGTDLYFSTSMSQAVSANDKIYSGLEVDKWYNVYIVINRSSMTRSVYISGEKVYSSKYTHGKDGGEQDYRRRMLLISNKGSIFFDNIEMFELAADEYKLERIRINSIVQSEKNIGYTDGKYPQGAVDMFKDTFAEVVDMDSLNEAFSALEARKIDTASEDETPAFIELDVPAAVNADKGTEAVVSLDAVVKTVSLNELSPDVVWEIIDSAAEGVYINGNELVVSEEATSGVVKLKASYDEVYAYAALKVNVVSPLVFQDFESFEEEYTNFGTEGFKEVRNVTLVEENNNKFISMTKTDLSTAYIVWEDNTLDSNVMATSVSFMIKDTEADGSVLGFTGALGQYSKGYIRVKGNNLYLRRSVDDSVEETDKIYSDLELNKWYSVYLVIDKNSMTRTVYLGGEKIYSSSYTHGKDGGEQDYRRRWIGKVNAGTLYVDNIGAFELTDVEFDSARLNAISYANNEASIGYSDGKYPQGAVDMLKDALKEAGDVDAVNKAVSEFKARKIDTSSDSEETAFIKINTPLTIGVEANAVNNIELLAEAASVNLSQTGDEVQWKILDSTLEASLSDNILYLPMGEDDGEVILEASSDNVYAYLPLTVHVLRDADITSFTAGDGVIEVSGDLTKKINLGAVLTVMGESINATVPIEIAKDLTFTASIDVGADAQWQDVSLIIEGAELNTLNKDVVFYGVGWEDGINTAINNCVDSDQTGEALGKYSLGLEIDEILFEKHTSVYADRTYQGLSYNDFNSLLAHIKDIQFVVAFYETVRADYEAFLTENIEFVTDAGLDVEALNSLDDSDKYQFYAELSKIDIDLMEDTPESICAELNEILDKVTVPETPSKPIGGGGGGGSSSRPSGGGGGGGGGGSSASDEDDFKVVLVPDEEAPKTEDTEKVTQFADVEEGYWAADALLYMREKNIMVGDGTSVRPQDRLTRGEFVKILAVAFELPKASGDIQFTDSNGKWWAEYAASAAELGIVNGLGDGSFGGEQPVTRQMMAVMVDRLITSRGIALYDQAENVTFTDYDLIADYAAEAVIRLGKKGIVSGMGNGLFAPSVTVKRAEAAQIIYNILKQL